MVNYLCFLIAAMKNFFRFLFSKTFVLNLIIAAVVIAVGLYLFMNFLDSYTRHNESVEVPDINGFHFSEIENFIADKNVTFQIIDSIDDAELPRGVVVDQLPKAGSFVKPGRKIYLTINSVEPPMVRMPELRDMTLRSAINRLETYGIKVGKLIPRPSDCTNCVVDILQKEHSVKAGTRIKKGGTVDIVVGAGLSYEMIPIPLLYELSYTQAEEKLMQSGLNLGIFQFDSTITSAEDSAKAFVYQQIPNYVEGGEINLGSSIDIILTLDSNKIPEYQLPVTDTTTLSTSDTDQP